jgi:hypothetical protein
MVNDPVNRDRSADKELVSADFEGAHLFDRRHVQQSMDGSMPALFQVEQ